MEILLMAVVIAVIALGAMIAAARKGIQSAGERSSDLLGYSYKESPNRSSRGSAKVTTLVFHYTAGITSSSAVSWLTNPAAKASAHFVVGRAGDVTQLVKLSEAAWHAGTATITNGESIGIEVVNPGRVEPDGRGGWTIDAAGARVPWKPDEEPVKCGLRWPSGKTVEGWWVPYTADQIEALVEIVSRLRGTPWGAACVKDMRGHEDIATPEGRKIDPGPLFPWGIFGDKYSAWQKHVTVRV